MDLKPPASEGLESSTVIFHFLDSMKRWYILNRSPAKMAASSPPAAERISTMVSFSSIGSPGMSMILMSSSSWGSFASFSEISIWSISFSSASAASCSISLATSMSSRAPRYSRAAFTRSVWWAYSLLRRVNSLISLATAGSESFFSSSSKAMMIFSSLSRMVAPYALAVGEM